MGLSRSLVGAVALATVGSAAEVAGADLQRFEVRQVRQLEVGYPAVRAYLDVEDSEGNPLAQLPLGAISATLGEWPAEVVALGRFDPATQGVSYVFLIDTSRSLSDDHFRQMVASLESWIGELQPLDRAAVIAFGDSSRLIADFTADPDSLRAALASLRPADDKTLLHQAIADALDLCRRLDPDLPGRRAIVVFSDGKDEGSGLEAEDVLAKLRSDPAPIYAIGFSNIRDLADRRRYLDLLNRLATNSGGAFLEAERTRIAESHESIRQAIGRVWVADFRCSDCRPDGRTQRLQVRIDLGGRALSDGGQVRLLPVERAVSRSKAEAPRQVSEVPRQLPTATPAAEDVAADRPEAVVEEALATEALGVTEEAPVESSPTQLPAATPAEPSAPERRLGLWLAVALVALALAGLVSWRFLGRPSQARIAAPAPEADLAPIPPPEKPKPRQRQTTEVYPKHVRLIVVRGSRRGREYGFSIRDRATVGKRSDCDVVLSEEPGIDPRQFELYRQGDDLFIRNLAEQHPTLLGGRPIPGRVPIKRDSVIGTGTTILRIVFH